MRVRSLVLRLIAHVNFECCCCTGAGEVLVTMGMVILPPTAGQVLVVDEHDLEWSEMATSTKKHVDPPLELARHLWTCG